MVLHKAYMPRVLIETGFISNTIEGNLLNSEEGQNEIAKAIADAIVSYKKEYYGNGEIEITGELPSQKINEKPIPDNTPVRPKITTPSEEPILTKKPVEDNGKPIFKVQLSATIKKVELSPSNFNGLKNISVSFENNVYKYMYGETTDYNEAKQDLQEAKRKGYNTAFLIAYKNGEKINVQDAIK